MNARAAFPAGGLAFVLIVIGTIGPLLFIFGSDSGDFLINRLGLRENILGGVRIIGFGSISLFLGYAVTPLSRRINYRPVDARSEFSAALLLWICFVVAVLMLLVFSGDIAASVTRLLQKTRGGFAYQSHIYILLTCILVELGVMFFLARHLNNDTTRPYCIAAAAVTVVLCFLMGSRVRALIALLIPFLFQRNGRFEVRRGWLIPAALVPLLVYLGDIIRRGAQGRVAPAHADVLGTFLSSFSLIDPAALTVSLRERVPVEAWDGIKANVLWLLPSSVVGQKEWIGSVAARYVWFGDTLGGLTLGFFGELYYYFGWAGLIFLSAACGSGLKVASSMSRRESLLGAAAAMCAIFAIFSSLRNGLMLDSLNYVLIFLVISLNAVVAAAIYKAASEKARALRAIHLVPREGLDGMGKP